MQRRKQRLIVESQNIQLWFFYQIFKLFNFLVMKKIVLSIALILTVCLSSMGNRFVAKGQSNSEFGDYRIEQLDDHLVLNNKELDQYLITYEKKELKVVVVLDKQKKCKKYYVLSSQVPVQYECDGIRFGVKKLDKELAGQGYRTNLDGMNKEEFFHQKVLVSGEPVSTLEHLNLIASYYPGLFCKG